MRYQSLSLLAVAGLTSARTPAGFQPAAQNELLVQYGNQAVQNGQVLAQQITQVQPTISTSQQLTGTYAVIMVDLDIPTGQAQTNTLLHWLQTGLQASQTGLQPSNGNGNGNGLNNGGGNQQQQAFLLQNTQNAAALAEYIGPNPPAMSPLSHRYTFVLVDHSQITQQGLQALQQASQTRLGFNTAQVLQQAGLTQNVVVAGNFFNVTNPGPAQPGGIAIGNGTTGGIIPGGNQPGGNLNPPAGGGGVGGGLLPGATNTNAFNQPAATGIQANAAAVLSASSGAVASLLCAAGIFFAL